MSDGDMGGAGIQPNLPTVRHDGLENNPDATSPEAIGSRLRTLRGARTQFEVAHTAHIHPNVWSRLETGKQGMGAEHVVAICRALGCTADFLLFGHGDTSPSPPATGTHGP